MNIQVVYAGENHFRSFYAALSRVAGEKIHIEMIEAPHFEKVAAFQRKLISMNAPAYYALEGDRVVGWCDACPYENPRLSHRAALGMGLLPAHRGQGSGSKLLSAALTHAEKSGIEKVELNVYTDNAPAVALYRKFGFEEEGLIRRYRKLDGRYFDCLAMGKFLSSRDP